MLWWPGGEAGRVVCVRVSEHRSGPQIALMIFQAA